MNAKRPDGSSSFAGEFHESVHEGMPEARDQRHKGTCIAESRTIDSIRCISRYSRRRYPIKSYLPSERERERDRGEREEISTRIQDGSRALRKMQKRASIWLGRRGGEWQPRGGVHTRREGVTPHGQEVEPRRGTTFRRCARNLSSSTGTRLIARGVLADDNNE